MGDRCGTMAVLKLRNATARACSAGRRCRGDRTRWSCMAGDDEQGRSRAGRAVNATGPWAAHVGRMVGLDLPGTGPVQQVIATEAAPPLTRHWSRLAQRHLSLKQQASGASWWVAAGFGGFDCRAAAPTIWRRNIEGNLGVCARVCRHVGAYNIVRSWTGINPGASTVRPYTGEVPGCRAFRTAVAANGYTLGPVVGRTPPMRCCTVNRSIAHIGWSGSAYHAGNQSIANARSMTQTADEEDRPRPSPRPHRH